jgi:hypothetical protein
MSWNSADPSAILVLSHFDGAQFAALFIRPVITLTGKFPA